MKPSKLTKKVIKDLFILSIIIFFSFIILFTIGVSAIPEFNQSQIPDNVGLGPGGYISPEREIEMSKENIKLYCYKVQSNLIWLIVLSMIIWIIEPKMKSIAARNKSHNQYVDYIISSTPFFLKWIGLGLLFMVGYSLYSLI